jgi:hypothetical protein
MAVSNQTMVFPLLFISKAKMVAIEGAEAGKYSRHFSIFKNGCPKNWIKWLMGFYEIKILMPLKAPVEKVNMLCTLLKGQALSHFEYNGILSYIFWTAVLGSKCKPTIYIKTFVCIVSSGNPKNA